MSYGTVQVGRVTLREAFATATENLNAQTGERTLALSGQESTPPLSAAEIDARHKDILGLKDSLVPVVFTNKTALNGYYLVKDVNTDLDNFTGEVIRFDWKVTLTRLGSDSEVDVESRLGGALTRSNGFALSNGERWHAPPIGHSAYWSGSTQPSTMTRTGENGAITVYRGVPIRTNPRYACPVGSYLNGRVKFLDATSRERAGTAFSINPASWMMTNGLVRIAPLSSGGVLEIGAYTGAWKPKNWNLLVSGATLGVPTGATLLRNDPECVILRLVWSQAVGRTEADLTLRRGARFVEVYIKRQFSATIRVQLGTAQAATSATGYIRATANDADGNRFILGSAQTFQSDLTNGAIFNSSVTELGAYIGVIAGGASPVAGDAGDDIRAQYLGAPTETVRGVNR